MTLDSGTDLERRLLGLMAEVTGVDLAGNLDLPLYAAGLLDSLGTVSLMVACEEALGVNISPAEFDPAAWATPRLFLADIRRRLAAGGPRA